MRSLGGIIGTNAAVTARPSRQNRHTTVAEVEGNFGLDALEWEAGSDIGFLLMGGANVCIVPTALYL